MYTGSLQGKKFPIASPHQIAYFRNSYGYPVVGVLVLSPGTRDESVQLYDQFKSWFAACGYDPQGEIRYTDYESVTVRGGSIQASLGAGCTILESFGSIPGPAGTKPKPNTKVKEMEKEGSPKRGGLLGWLRKGGQPKTR